MVRGKKMVPTGFSPERRPRRLTFMTVKKAYTELNLIYSDRGKVYTPSSAPTALALR
jgi:hypothetical protein